MAYGFQLVEGYAGDSEAGAERGVEECGHEVSVGVCERGIVVLFICCLCEKLDVTLFRLE